MKVLGLLVLLTLAFGDATAAIEAQTFPNDAVKVRYYDLIAEFRCPQCLNTNLAGSDAMIAQDLRKTILRLLIDGKTDAEIETYLYDRYGDFILYEPRLTPRTWLLWLGPVGLGVMGFWIWLSLGWKSKRLDANALSEDEQRRVQQLLDRS
jgi:cytochrome c-type biogenesis protein CcmH